MGLFFIFEHLCFEDLSKTLLGDLMTSIDKEKEEMIIRKLLKNYNNKSYTLKDLGAALRRYISRYLVGSTQIIDIQNTRSLPFELTRQELWEKKVWASECDLENEIKKQIGEFKLEVRHAFQLYKLIGGDDMKEIQFLYENIGEG